MRPLFQGAGLARWNWAKRSKAANLPSKFAFLYPLEASIKAKIETIAREVYGADGVDYSEREARVEQYTRLGYDKLPICMAKTHLSLSHDPALKGVPKGFRIPIRDIKRVHRGRLSLPAAGDDEHYARPADPTGVL